MGTGWGMSEIQRVDIIARCADVPYVNIMRANRGRKKGGPFGLERTMVSCDIDARTAPYCDSCDSRRDETRQPCVLRLEPRALSLSAA